MAVVTRGQLRFYMVFIPAYIFIFVLLIGIDYTAALYLISSGEAQGKGYFGAALVRPLPCFVFLNIIIFCR